MPTLTAARPLNHMPKKSLNREMNGRKITVPVLFAWDIIRLTLNPNAKPTSGAMMATYTREKPWEKLEPKDLGCQTEIEKLDIVANLIRSGGRSVKANY